MDIIKYYGSDETKTEFINHDSEPLMAVIAHDRSPRSVWVEMKWHEMTIINCKRVFNLLYTRKVVILKYGLSKYDSRWIYRNSPALTTKIS